MWKKISSKVIFKHPRIKLIEDEVKLPSGKTTKYLKFGNVRCATLICKKKNKILLQKEYSYPPNRTLLEFPGGSIAVNKDAKKEANRELMEETDLKANKLKLLGRYLMNNRRSNAQMYVYLATDLVEESLESDEEEDTEQVWVTESEIDGLIRKGKFENSYSLAAWSMYKVNKNN